MSHGPVQEEYRARMNELAAFLNHQFNGDGPKKVGFALLIYPLGQPIQGDRLNYIGNGMRADVLTAIKELAARWEGRYAETETSQ